MSKHLSNKVQGRVGGQLLILFKRQNVNELQLTKYLKADGLPGY
jgi:hypothetical protein